MRSSKASSARSSGRTYSIVRGIPRFVDIEDAGQQQTAETFGFKWHQRDSYDSPGFREFALDWFLERYGFESQEDLRRFFSGRELTLDAGCGAGFTASLWLEPGWRGDGDAEWVALDISTAIDVAQDRLGIAPWHAFRAGRRLAFALPRRDVRYHLF